jgi:hypothetical protein
MREWLGRTTRWCASAEESPPTEAVISEQTATGSAHGLWKGGSAAVASTDPMIKLLCKLDPEAPSANNMKTASAPLRAAAKRLARAPRSRHQRIPMPRSPCAELGRVPGG